MSNNTKLLWALSLGAISFLGPEFDIKLFKEMNTQILSVLNEGLDVPDEVVLGHTYTDIGNTVVNINSRIKEFVVNRFKITDFNTYRSVMQDLKVATDENNSLLYEMKRIKLMSYKDRLNWVYDATDGNKDKRNYREAMLKHMLHFRYKDMLAYNMANAIALTRLAGQLGYIDIATVKEQVLEFAETIEENFSSYRDFGLRANSIYELETLRFKQLDFSESYEYVPRMINAAYYGLWNDIPWKGNYEEDI